VFGVDVFATDDGSTDERLAWYQFKVETDSLQDFRDDFEKSSQENGHFPAVIEGQKQ
jgi:hypothetical protein